MSPDHVPRSRVCDGAVDTTPARVPFLDALRGLAALSVVIVHIVMLPSPNLATPIEPMTLIYIGSTGVCVFFAISTYSLFYTMPLRLRETHPLTSFYLRRFFRIAPLFYFWLAVRLLYDYWTAGRTYAPGEILANVTFTFNLVPSYIESMVLAGWTVGVEELFYATFPLIFWCVRGIKSAVAFCVVTALAAMGMHAYLRALDATQPWVAGLTNWSFAIHAQTFAMGALAFFVGRRLAVHPWIARRRLLVSLSLVTIAVVVLGAFSERSALLTPYLHWQGIICVLFIVGLEVQTLPIVDNVITRYLGRISFSFYLCHPLVIAYLIPAYRRIYTIVGQPTLSLLCCVLVTCAILIPIAEVTYRLIEERGIATGRALYRRIANSEPPRYHSVATMGL
jgi:peptidoglycan/LPS O-acetylase OafA/YrhL